MKQPKDEQSEAAPTGGMGGPGEQTPAKDDTAVSDMLARFSGIYQRLGALEEIAQSKDRADSPRDVTQEFAHLQGMVDGLLIRLGKLEAIVIALAEMFPHKAIIDRT